MDHPFAAIVFGLTLFLTGCGGGETEPAPATSVPTMRALAQLTPQGTVDQLMNFAETNYPQFFPGHKATASWSPFAYRYYPETGIYLGVVVFEGSAYSLNGVYVMGGAFGDTPQYVGPLTSFIAPTSSADNGCSNLALFDTQGTHVLATYQQSGPTAGTTTVEITVGGVTTFNGFQARETDTLTTSNLTVRGTPLVSTVAIKNYANHTGDGQTTLYGNTMVAGSDYGAPSTGPITQTTTFAPPWVNAQFALQVGQTETDTYVMNSRNNLGSVFSTSVSTSITYVGRETITVPAGTYSTCRFDTVSSPQLPASSSWYSVGQGILIQSGTLSDSNLSRATSVYLNGQRL